MSTDILDHFEMQIEVLIEQYERLKQENVRLRDKQAELITECNDTRDKHAIMVNGIEKMIERLKIVESENG